MDTLVMIGIPLTAAIFISEIVLIIAEVQVTPLVLSMPIVGVPLETVLVVSSMTLINIEVAYWSFTYRVMRNPEVKQKFELLLPYGLEE